jgi:two-component system response regulator NreC
MITVLLVDDHFSVRRTLRMELELEPDMRVLGEAEDGIEALAQASRLHPQVVVMDVKMPRMDGITATSELMRLLPDSKVIMLSLYDDKFMREEARSAGAVALIGKCDPPEMLLEAIRLSAGDTVH